MDNIEKPACKACGKKFDTKEALNQHFNAKHYEKPKEIAVQKKISYGKYIFWLALVFLLVLIGWAVWPDSLNPNAQYTPLLPDEEHFKGNPEAEDIIIEFSDFECPFCASFYKQTFPDMQSKYINTNEIKFVFKHFPLTQLHNFAFKAAEAAECAADQGKFWEMHDMLFERSPQLSTRALKQYAEEIGLDAELFNNCLDSGVMESRVRNDMKEGINKGIKSTPSFLVNEKLISGTQPLSAFEQLLNQ